MPKFSSAMLSKWLTTSAKNTALCISSKWQATRLCNAHPYKRPKFDLPQGLSVERLNTTIACTRNRAAAQLPSMIDAFNAESEPVVVLHETSS